MADFDFVIQFIYGLRIVIAIAAGIFIAFGIFRGKRDTYFYVSVAVLIGYLAVVGGRHYGIQQRGIWIEEADAKRDDLKSKETWAFDPATITTLHLDWPVRKDNHGRLRLSSHLPMGRIWQVADPESEGFLEIGRNPIYRAEVLVGDVRCFSSDPDLVLVSELTNEDRKARGICLKAVPVEVSEAEVRLSYDRSSVRRGGGWESRSEWRLETKRDGLIDRIVTASGTGVGNSFFLPKMDDGASRRLSEYKDGPIIALRDWLSDQNGSDADVASSPQGLQNLKQRAGLEDTLLIEGLATEHGLLKFTVLHLACKKWDVASPALREAITAMLRRELPDRPRARYMHECGRNSCTPDNAGFGPPGECKTQPPQVVVPEFE